MYTPPTHGHGSLYYGVWFYYAFVYWIQPGVAFSVYSDGLDVVFDISRGETSVCNDILALCGLIGDKSREVVVGVMSALQG